MLTIIKSSVIYFEYQYMLWVILLIAGYSCCFLQIKHLNHPILHYNFLLSFWTHYPLKIYILCSVWYLSRGIEYFYCYFITYIIQLLIYFFLIWTSNCINHLTIISIYNKLSILIVFIDYLTSATYKLSENTLPHTLPKLTA